MKKNVVITASIVLLFIVVLAIENGPYLTSPRSNPVNHGAVVIQSNQLQSTIKLNGQWSFYPNLLIPVDQPLEIYADSRMLMQVPDKWKDHFEFHKAGPLVGTYHLSIKVPKEGQYSLLFQSVYSSSKIFINGIEVGGKGNPSKSFIEFQSAIDDNFTVYSQSQQGELDILVHVAGYNQYSKAGINYPVEFGTKEQIDQLYQRKNWIYTLVSIGHLTCGAVFLISYGQNRRRKEELFLGLTMLLISFFLSIIKQKIFFQMFPIVSTVNQLRLQLGVIPLILICTTLFLHVMYPKVVQRKSMYLMITELFVFFFIYGIYNPLAPDKSEANQQNIILNQILYIIWAVPPIIYLAKIMIQIMRKKLEGASYILITFVASCCYSALTILDFFTEIPLNYSPLVFFLCILVSFASLLNYRANAAFIKMQAVSEELITQDGMKNKFLLKTSQELRTPLEGVLNLSKLLMEGAQGPLKRTQQEQVILIHNITQRMEHLVDNLLFSSSHMSGELRISRRAVSINIINDVVTEIRNSMTDSEHIRLIVEIDSNAPPMLTDELRFKQVLYNLLHNAFQHTRAGEIKVTAYPQHQQMIIEVSDTGIGIPPEDVDHIFDAFYQVKNNDLKKGLGLGLSIVKNIVHQLQGEVYVKSILGEGSLFTFTMPLATEEMVSIENSLGIDHASASGSLHLDLPFVHEGNQSKVLVVADHHINLKVLADTLLLKGYTVIGVDNSVDAIDYMATNHVDCMVIDMMVGDVSSYDLCKQVRSQYDMLELPIIVLTTIMQHSDVTLTLQLGVNDYLQKPVTRDEFLLRVESLLAVRQTSLDAIEVEMNYLYTQVAPHFVYNTLNSIIGLSYSDMDQTREALYSLSTYFRAKLNVHYRNSMVWIEEELELVQAYLSIEKMRLGERLTVHYDIDESIQLMIPALSLQPLVENAIIHGLSKKNEGGTIKISVRRQEALVKIEIYDNGVGIPAQKLEQLLNDEGTRIGFANPLRKFKLIKHATLDVYSEEGRYTRIVILLPEGGR
ncbi:sensor histidine kinase [Paenibacillus senegalimassiliensis]|uniref:sensor histidine kinase n=1 Tax=Paenibacillus senegalimassiliensis TaxID=1737426 RepID=UPI00073F0561|nr:ATP-binding protein [Paenibacillus senegalimassiliensis]